MKLSHFLSISLLPLALLFAGCAKSPAGGGPVNNAPNRLQVTLNLKGTLSTRAYYAVAFDDDVAREGPKAIVSGSRTTDAVMPLNGVASGSFRFVVIYSPEGFAVYRRTNPSSPNQEIIERSSLPFVSGRLPVASANAINFTLDLDARDSSGNFYFAHDAGGGFSATQLKINAIATTRPFRNPDERIKPVDALGGAPGLTSTPETFLVSATRRATLNDDFGNADKNFYDDSFNNTGDADYVNFSQLDIRTLDLVLTRG